MTVLSATKLSLTYADVEIFSNINLQIPDNARIGMVGPNGAGKTSLLKVIVGEVEPDDGQLHRNVGLRIGYVPQVRTPPTEGTLRDEIMTAFDRLQQLGSDLDASAQALAQATPAERVPADTLYASLLDQFEALGGYDYQSRLEKVCAGLGLSQQSLDAPATSASGGEQTRGALAKALLSNPDLLVLDEPTNYLDMQGITWLERLLSHYPQAFLVVSHDRYFLDRVVNQIWEMDHEQLQSFTGNYTKYRVLKGEQTLWQRRRYQRQQEFIAKEEAFIRRYGAGQRAREAKGREKRLDRLERFEAPTNDARISLSKLSASRTENVVLRTERLKIGFTEDGRVTELFSVPDLRLERRQHAAIIGDNGTGKTTLVKTILGLNPAVAGSVILADKAQVGYFRQEQDAIPEELTVFEALLEAKNIPLDEVRPYLARFLFRGEEVFQEVGSLSGGERSRLALARLLINQPNLLILDEPTTHLDIATREALEKVLTEYEGTILLVSHDRHLVSLMAKQLWIVDEGELHLFPGTFAEWEQKKQAEYASQPKPAPARPMPARPIKETNRNKHAPQNSAAPEKRRTRNPQAPDSSTVITTLEARLQEIERQLEAATESQDLMEITRLGEEHAATQTELAEKWLEWAE